MKKETNYLDIKMKKKTPDDEICTLALVYMTKAEKLENFI